MTLTNLSDSELVSRLDSIRKTERKLTIEVITQLAEMERRGLYLEMGYGSLFDYCTRRLGYSESGAVRRVRTAGCVRRFPEVLGMLRRGEVNTVVISKVASLLTEENKTERLEQIRGRSQAEVDVIVALWRPGGRPVRDRIRPICVRRPASAPVLGAASAVGVASALGVTTAVPEKCTQGYRHSGGKKLATIDAPTAVQKEIERHFKFEFGADEVFMERYREVRRLMATRDPRQMDIAGVFSVLMNEYIDRHSPEKKARRRAQRKKQKPANRAEASKTEANKTEANKVVANRAKKRTRHIPRRIRDEVLQRDGWRCTYKSPGGVRCTQDRGLQVDHVVPYARGGPNTPHNLRVRCAEHNRLEARRIYGAAFMERKLRSKSPLGKSP